jgi:D-alanyl-D-alanine carboxypeptidase (penicillin-binding protein 5/6)
MNRIALVFLLLLFTAPPVHSARAKVEKISVDPYISALAVDGRTGKILINNNGAAQVFPASVVKLMDLLVIIEKIEEGALRLDEQVQVTEEAARMGGSQVYLDPREQFSIEDLLYAMMVQSANDAAVALALHVAGSKEGFVALMNDKARELGMNNSSFYSVHGLPPSKGQNVDVTTAEDLALLALELVKRPQVLKVTSTRQRDFRDGQFVLRTHNHLLENVLGADGLKTGYFQAAGFSIVATAQREGARVIAIVMGSENRETRDREAAELIEKGFALLPPAPEKPALAVKDEGTGAGAEAGDKKVSPAVQTAEHYRTEVVGRNPARRDWSMFFYGLVVGAVLVAGGKILLPVKKKKIG